MPRSWHEMEDQIIRKLVKSETPPSVPDDNRFAFDADRRAMAERWEANGKAPALAELMSHVRGAEERIAKARAAGLNGRDLERVRHAESERLLQRVEKVRADRLRRLYDQIDTAMKKHHERRDADPTRSLLQLRRAEMEYADFNEQAAIGRLKLLAQKGGHTADVLLVLGSKGKRARAAARDLERDWPTALSDEHGRKLLEEADELVSRPTGTVSYSIEGVPAKQTVAALSLLTPDVTPSAEEFIGTGA